MTNPTWYAALLVVALAPAAHADIYKCTDEHGNVAYLQTPCPIEVPEEPAVADETDDPVPEVEEVEDVTESLPEPLESCKKRYRDQIDEIDAELRTSFSSAQADAYKERLLELTKQLRACG